MTSRTVSFFATKPSTIAKKKKPSVIMLYADDGPDPAISAADYAATEKGSRMLDVVFIQWQGCACPVSCCREPL